MIIAEMDTLINSFVNLEVSKKIQEDMSQRIKKRGWEFWEVERIDEIPKDGDYVIFVISCALTQKNGKNNYLNGTEKLIYKKSGEFFNYQPHQLMRYPSENIDNR